MSGGGKDILPSVSDKFGHSSPASGSSGSSGSSSGQVFPAAMPGQLESLAAQLGQGFGQQPADMLAYLNSIYKPVKTTGFASDVGATKAAPKPATTQTLSKQLEAMLGYAPEVMMKGNSPYVKNPMSGGWVPYGNVAEFHKNGSM